MLLVGDHLPPDPCFHAAGMCHGVKLLRVSLRGTHTCHFRRKYWSMSGMPETTIAMRPWDEGPKYAALSAAANVLYNAQLSGRPRRAIHDTIAPYSHEGSEEVLRINFLRGIAEGRRLAGRVSQVHRHGETGANVHGYLFSDAIHANGQDIPSNHMVVPSVSPVIVLAVTAPLTSWDVNVAELLAACGSVHAGLIVHSQRSGDGGGVSTLECQADNAHAAHVALTSRHLPTQGLNFDGLSATVTVTAPGGFAEPQSFAFNPYALMHLTASVRKSIALLGPVLPGEILVTPPMGQPQDLPPSSTATATFEQFGVVHIRHSEAEFEEGFLPMNSVGDPASS